MEKKLNYEKEKGEKLVEGLKAADEENKELKKVCSLLCVVIHVL